MRKLSYSVDLKHFEEIKQDIVPNLFTEHQFDLIRKRFSNKKLTDSEKNEFSRTISKKMAAINKIIRRETEGIYVYGREKIRADRLKKAVGYIKKLSRKFKNKHIIITGSFLYKKDYNDIDVFVISKYEKEDYNIGKVHVNYFTEDVYNSLFFQSVKKLCLSNTELHQEKMKEKIDINTLISLYQELFNDIDRKFEGVKSTLREFLLQAAFIGNFPIPDSSELRQQAESVLKAENPTEIIKNIFVNAVSMGVSKYRAIAEMKSMVSSYRSIMEEYKQHRKYYTDLIEAFNRVILIEG